MKQLKNIANISAYMVFHSKRGHVPLLMLYTNQLVSLASILTYYEYADEYNYGIVEISQVVPSYVSTRSKYKVDDVMLCNQFPLPCLVSSHTC